MLIVDIQNSILNVINNEKNNWRTRKSIKQD